MKKNVLWVAFLSCAASMIWLSPAQARTSVDFGVYVTPGPYYDAYPVVPVYPYGYTYEPPVVVVPAPVSPPVYVERYDGDDDADYDEGRPGPANYWYRCDKPKGYYPYVRKCKGGWHTEVPSAPYD